MRAVIDRHSASGRVGESEEIADAIAFLCSHSARFVNGAELVVDPRLLTGTAALLRRERAVIEAGPAGWQPIGAPVRDSDGERCRTSQ